MAAVVELIEDVVGAVGKAASDVVDFIDPQKLVDSVAGAMSNIFKPIENIFEAVGDVVESAVEFVGDVVEKVGNVVQAVIDDPLPVLLSIAGAAVGIPPYVTMGAITAARGGDLEDVILSMGTAYVGSAISAGVGTSISSTVSSTFIESGLNETFSVVAGDAISKGLVNGTIAEIRGGSFEDGFAGGFTGGLVAGGVTEVASYVQPSVISLAMDSGLDLRDATSVFNAGVKAVSAGVTSEITGRGDFATSFANSAIGSAVDYGVRSVNSSIDEQFRTAATDWNEKDQGENPIDVAITGAGIPDEIVTQVKVSEIGFDTPSVDSLAETPKALDDPFMGAGETATSDVSVLPKTELTEAPKAETVYDFADLIGADRSAPVDGVVPVTKTEDTQAGVTSTADTASTAGTTGIADTIVSQAPAAETAADFKDLISTTGVTSDDAVLADTSTNLPSDVVDIAKNYPEEAVVTGVPTGALASVSDNIVFNDASETPPEGAAVSTPLASVSEVLQPINLPDVETQEGAVLPDAAIAENLLINPSTKDETEEQPIGGLNAVSPETPQEKIAPSSGIKATNISKPVISTIGSAIKSALNRKPTAARPVGGLRSAGVRPAAVKPPARMDVAKLIPIQKAAPIKKTVGPAKTLGKDAKLTPITNIANLTSLVKKAG